MHKLESAIFISGSRTWTHKKSQAVINMTIKRRRNDSLVLNQISSCPTGFNSVRSSKHLIPISYTNNFDDFAIKLTKPTISGTESFRHAKPLHSRPAIQSNTKNKQILDFNRNNSQSRIIDGSYLQDEVSLYRSRISMAAARANIEHIGSETNIGLNTDRIKLSKRSYSDMNKNVLNKAEMSNWGKSSMPVIKHSVGDSVGFIDDCSKADDYRSAVSFRVIKWGPK